MMTQRFFITSMLFAGLTFGTGVWADSSIQMASANTILMADAGEHDKSHATGDVPDAMNKSGSNGNHNSAKGNDNSSKGDHNKAKGNHNSSKGNHNKAKGSHNSPKSNHNNSGGNGNNHNSGAKH